MDEKGKRRGGQTVTIREFFSASKVSFLNLQRLIRRFRSNAGYRALIISNRDSLILIKLGADSAAAEALDRKLNRSVL